MILAVSWPEAVFYSFAVLAAAIVVVALVRKFL